MKRFALGALLLFSLALLILVTLGAQRYGGLEGLIFRVRVEIAERRPKPHPAQVPTPLPTPTPAPSFTPDPTAPWTSTPPHPRTPSSTRVPSPSPSPTAAPAVTLTPEQEPLVRAILGEDWDERAMVVAAWLWWINKLWLIVNTLVA